MKRSVLILFFALIISVFLVGVISQDDSPEDVWNVEGIAGNINPQTGLPKSFEKFKEVGDKLSEEESSKDYLKQEWTKILADNKVLSPILFYTNNFFSFFNPLWGLIFGVEFSWSWFFVFSFIIWILIIILIYNPLQLQFNAVISFLISVIISSLLGFFNIIEKTVDFLTPLISNIWAVLISIVLIIALIIAYIQLFRSLKQKQEKDVEKFNRERLKQDVKVADIFAKGVSEGLR